MRGITLYQAQQIIEHSHQIAKTKRLPPLSLVVLDSGGHVKLSTSDDGVGIARYEIAKGKANAALGMGFGTKGFHQLIEQKHLPEMFANCIGSATGSFIPLPGGVLIIDDRHVIGAIGVSGANSDQDEWLAVSAVEQVGLTAG